jgi:type IV pilus assembly protein PilX
MLRRDRVPGTRGQGGVVLVTGLIFMVILTLIVLALLRSGTLEERMAANARNRQIALQAAEAVLRDAEISLFPSGFAQPVFTDACTDGFCAPPSGSTPRWKTVDWTSASTTRSFASGNSNLSASLVASQPRYIVERVSAAPCPNAAGLIPMFAYRITARGVGQDSSEAIVQSIYWARPSTC